MAPSISEKPPNITEAISPDALAAAGPRVQTGHGYSLHRPRSVNAMRIMTMSGIAFMVAHPA